jgi:hypothetical protein
MEKSTVHLLWIVLYAFTFLAEAALMRLPLT